MIPNAWTSIQFRGTENLALAETGSSSDSVAEEGQKSRRRSRSRGRGLEEEDSGPRFLGPQVKMKRKPLVNMRIN